MDEMTSVARQEEGVTFYLTSDENVAAKVGAGLAYIGW